MRAPGPVGHDTRALISRLPAMPREPSAARSPSSGDAPAPVEPSTADREPTVAFRSKDDTDLGWGREQDGSNDDRLQRDKPPHW